MVVGVEVSSRTETGRKVQAYRERHLHRGTIADVRFGRLVEDLLLLLLSPGSVVVDGAVVGVGVGIGVW